MLEGESAELGYFCPLRTKMGFSGSSNSSNHFYSSVPFFFSSRPPQRFCSLRFNLPWRALLGPFSAQQVCRSCSAAHTWFCFTCGFLLANPEEYPQGRSTQHAHVSVGHTHSALTFLLAEHIQVRLFQSGIIHIALVVINISLISQLQ